ncbi:tetratricopeptide repeat protein [Flavobacterium zepuense]|uniref:tetratricopeptide repeat protein n=1 Tax=Flavobacterium zepuense TaxID=2593302 RepID=UPI00163D44FC|nr:tetratricopeptide repeat protein [Flavobacterium zepuense]
MKPLVPYLPLLILLFLPLTIVAQTRVAISEDYRIALEKHNAAADTTTAQFYYERGGIRQDHLDDEGAIVDYNKAIQLKPNNPKAYYNRGLAKLNLKLLSNAITDFDKAIELDPEKADTYNNRGIAKHFLKKYQAAIKDYDAAISINPTHAEAYNNRGISKIKSGNVNDGCEDLHKAFELGDKASSASIKKYCEE